MAAMISLVIMLIGLGVELGTRNNFERKLKFTSDADLQRVAAFIDYVREKHPQKLYFKK